MKPSPATFIASVCLLLAGCGAEEQAKGPEVDWQPYAPGATPTERVDPGVEFVDVAREAGIDFTHVTGADGRKLLPETMGAGVGIFDYDGDGDLDLLFVQSRQWTGADQPTQRLYRNDGDWRFTDVTKGSGLDVSCYGMGCTIADYDADGDPDVYLTCLGPNLLFRNVDGKRFERVAGAPDGGTWTDDKGVVHPSWSTGAAWFDADRDGDLDLLVVSYVRWTEATDIYATLVENVKAYTRPQLYAGDQVRLYLQEEDGSFRDATKGSGLDATRVAGKSLAVCLDDFDGDGQTDVFVANDTVQNFLFLGKGGAKFEEKGVEAAIAYDDQGQARAAMGVGVVDYRNDGRLTIFIGNFSEEPVSAYTVSRTGARGVLFQDDAQSARIGHPTLLPLTFGLLTIDVDLDGWCDLFLANGHIEPSITQLKRELTYAQTPQYLRNLEGRRFHDVTLEAGATLSNRVVGRGLAAGDLDGDGDLDLVLTSNGGAPLVLRCDRKTANRALRLRLRQPGTRNPEALSAVVRVTAGDTVQRRVVATGGSYLSQGDLAVTVGLGDRPRAERVEVTWPDGTTKTWSDLAARAEPHVLSR